MSKQRYPRDRYGLDDAARAREAGHSAPMGNEGPIGIAKDAEETRCAWALWPAKGGGFAWCRVLLPVSVVERYRSGPEYVPDQKGIALAKIEVDMASESVTTRRGWT